MSNFKCNFKNGSDEYLCPLDYLHDDSQENLLKCNFVKCHLPELSSTEIKYDDLFSNNPAKIKITMELLIKAFKIRESLIEKLKPYYKSRIYK